MNTEERYLALNNRDDKEIFFSLFGGRDALASQFKATSAVYRHTVENDAATNAGAASDAMAKVLLLHIGYKNASKDTIRAFFFGKGQADNVYTYLKAVVRKKSDKTQVSYFHSVNFVGSSTTLMAEMDAARYRDYYIDVYLVNTSSAVTVLVKTIDPAEYGVGVGASFTVNDPRKIRVSNPDTIRVALYSARLTDADYSFTSDKVQLPASGSVTLCNETFREVVNTEMILTSTQQKKPARHNKITTPSLAGDVMTWDMPTDWQSTGSDFCVKNIQIYAKYYLTMTCRLVGSTQLYQFLVTNDSNAVADAVHDINKNILIMLDCVAEGTRVRMADGTELPIEQIKAGDSVRNAVADDPVAVVAAGKANENATPAFLEWEDGRRLYCSVTHPVLTDQGFRSANLITPGTPVWRENGLAPVATARADCAEEPKTFYALTLAEGARGYYANGVAVGDTAAQSEVCEMESDARNMIDPHWLADYDAFEAMNKKEAERYE